MSRVWPGLEERTYAFGDMVSAGALLQLGSDAPVAPLDPWLAMSAAVGRRTPDGSVWSPDQRLTAEEALAASVNGAGPVAVGSPADLVLLAEDPLRLGAEELAGVQPRGHHGGRCRGPPTRVNRPSGKYPAQTSRA